MPLPANYKARPGDLLLWNTTHFAVGPGGKYYMLTSSSGIGWLPIWNAIRADTGNKESIQVAPGSFWSLVSRSRTLTEEQHDLRRRPSAESW